MERLEQSIDSFHNALGWNGSNFSGAIDIIVVPKKEEVKATTPKENQKQNTPNETTKGNQTSEEIVYQSTPFHVRFGKFQVLSTSDKIVSIYVNEQLIPDVKMKLGPNGEAYFVEQPAESAEFTESLISSPIASSPVTPRRQFVSSRDDITDDKLEVGVLTEKLQDLIQNENQTESEKLINIGQTKPEEKKEELLSSFFSPLEPMNYHEMASSYDELNSTPPPINNPKELLQNNSESNSPQDNSPEKKNQTWLDWTWGRLPTKQKVIPPEISQEKHINNNNEITQTQQQKINPENQGYLSKMGSLFRIFKGRNNQTTISPPDPKKGNETQQIAGNFQEKVKEEIQKETIIEESLVEIDEDTEEENKKEEDSKAMVKEETEFIIPKFEISRCGHILRPPNWKNISYSEAQKIFNENKLEYDEISEIPDLIFDSNILFRINDIIYPWSIAGPWMVSLIVYKKPLRKDTLKTLEEKYDLEKNQKNQKKGWKEWLWRKKENVPLVPIKEIVLEASARSELSKVKASFMIKSLRPTSFQLKSFNLKFGVNHIRFQISSGKTKREIRARIFLWNPNSRIIISDIDGTITKSDVFGQIMPMLGKDWSHSGVAQLYSNIIKNNYKILYLTSRAIGQADLTRGYISNLKQDENSLPEGPVIMSPSRLISAFHQEVIRKTPEEFKISALLDIKKLFPTDRSPFYAGFGNRSTDSVAYRAVDVPFGKIFTINYQGDINVVNHTFKKTYSTLNELIQETFPYNSEDDSANYHREEWNSYQYWRSPPSELE